MPDNPVHIIILDFDGTLIESVGIKDKAFEELFKAYPFHLSQIMEYHLAHNATIRFEKFEYIYKNILNIEYSEEIRKELSARFSNLVFTSIVKCPFVKGSLGFLNLYVELVPLCLVSMSPKQELKQILKEKGLTKYFKRVYSSEYGKKEAIEDILNKENEDAGSAVYIGDAFEDYQVALTTGVRFIARDSGKPFHKAQIRVYEDMEQIQTVLEKTILIKN